MAFDLEETITSWKIKYGEKRLGKKYNNEYYAIPIRERKDLFRNLVQTFKDKGEDKDFFKQHRVKTAIAEACFPPLIYDQATRRRGHEALFRELREVVAEFWPDTDVKDARDNIKNNKVSDEYNPAIHPSPFKDLDRSKLKEVPKPQNDIDREASILLGFDDE